MRKKIVFFCFSFLLLFGATAGAAILTFTDTTTKTGFDIIYTMDYSLVSGSTFHAFFTVDGSGSTNNDQWYAGAFSFKFSNGSTPSEISSLSAPSGTGPWSITDGTTNSTASIDGWSRTDGFSGFYLTDLANNLTFANAQKGIQVAPGASSSAETFEFDFTIPGGGTLNTDLMPFRVGYWDGAKSQGGLYFGQLSQDLGHPVPEPSTLLLLGTGLIGLAGYGRKKFRI